MFLTDRHGIVPACSTPSAGTAMRNRRYPAAIHWQPPGTW